MYIRKFFKDAVSFFLAAIVIFMAAAQTAAAGKNNDESAFTGHWQFVNSMSDVPCSGHVLLSYAKDDTQMFYGSLQATENKHTHEALENSVLQIDDDTKDSFMLIQDGQKFYIQLSDSTYLKRTGDLTNAGIETTENIEEATAFSISQSGFGTNNFACYRIYEPYGLSDLSLTVQNGEISLSSAFYSRFYMMAEATKIKVPPFGSMTKLARFLAIVAVAALLGLLLYLYKKDILNLITFGTAGLCSIALLVIFMLFAITTEEPGLYVLHVSEFESEPITEKDERKPFPAYYQPIENGCGIFVFKGNENSPYVWGCNLTDDTFSISTTGGYTNGEYAIQLKCYIPGEHDITFYYYDSSQDITSAEQALSYHITVDENRNITAIDQYTGEV